VLVLPIGVTTLTVLVETVAVPEITKLAVAVAPPGATTMLFTEMPEPVTVIPVAPVSALPVRVTGTVLPRMPVIGAIEASVGPVTVNGTVMVVPPGVVTLTVLVESVAPDEIAKFAVTVVSPTMVIPLTVMPDPDTFTAVSLERPVPVRVTGTVVPRTPVLGAIEVSVGGVTVNATAPLVPPFVVIVTVLGEEVALAAIAKFAVTVVAFTMVMPLTVTPEPETAIDCVPVRFVPVRVTATVVARAPEIGLIAVSVGGATLPLNSTAPTSSLVPVMSGRGLPKKSVVGAAVYAALIFADPPQLAAVLGLMQCGT
jgi:hypothetical protein